MDSIQQIFETCSKDLFKVKEDFANSRSITAFEQESLQIGMKFLCAWMGNVFEEFDEEIRNLSLRKKDWEIVRRDTKQLITRVGTVTFRKTLYRHKETGRYEYLFDRALELEDHQRMTDLVVAEALKEAVESSYRKGGETASLGDAVVSKSGVMEKIHALDFSKVKKKNPKEKRAVPYLYIDADEDHVSLQYREKKGDLTVGKNGSKNNCIFAKLAYVYEGVEPEAPKSDRYRLIRPHYFSGVYKGTENKKFWQEIYEYLDENYDLSQVKRIYLNSDGGAWIKGADEAFGRLTKVLDEFHLNKYLLKITGGLLDSAEDARAELIGHVKAGRVDEFGATIERIVSLESENSARKRIAESANYVLNNWQAAKVRLRHRGSIVGCSAEGHVSHVLSSRMSSRPLGWSEVGTDKMAHLRAYYYNQGDMLELVESQKLPVAAGSEMQLILSAKSAMANVGKNQYGKYVDAARATVSIGTKKAAWFSAGVTFI